MLIVSGVIGGIFLFLGRELNFLFAAAMAAWIALRLTPLLPIQWPDWSPYAFIAVLALLAAVITILRERLGYVLTGFLVGGSILVEYYEPGVLTLPLLPFLVGGTIGSFIMGFLTEWALVIISSLVGAYALTNLFRLSSMAEMLVGSGLFILGALTQAILMHLQKED